MYEKRVFCFTVAIVGTSLALLVAGHCPAKFTPVEPLNISDITGEWFSYRWGSPSSMMKLFRKVFTFALNKIECATSKGILQDDKQSVIFETSLALMPNKTFHQHVKFDKPDVGLFKILKADDPILSKFTASSVAILGYEPQKFVFGVVCSKILRIFKMQLYFVATREKKPNTEMVDNIKKALNVYKINLDDMNPLCTE